MEELKSIIDLATHFINGVGFPVAVCIALFYMNYKNGINNNATICEFKNVVENNTQILKELVAKIGSMTK